MTEFLILLLIGFLCVGALGEYIGGFVFLFLLIAWITGSLAF